MDKPKTQKQLAIERKELKWALYEAYEEADERIRRIFIPNGDIDCIPLPEKLQHICKLDAKYFNLKYHNHVGSIFCSKHPKDVVIFSHARPWYLSGPDICRTCFEEKIKLNLPWRTEPHWRTEPCTIVEEHNSGYRDRDEYTRTEGNGRTLRPHQVDHIDKTTALNLRLDFYFPKQPCGRGHIDFRDIRNDRCYSCEKEEEAILKGKVFKPHLRLSGGIKKQQSVVNKVLAPEGIKSNISFKFFGTEELQKLDTKTQVCSLSIRKQLSEVFYFARTGRKELPEDIIQKLGYSSRDLRIRLQRLFQPDQDWSNWGKTWALDHIISVKFLSEHGLLFPHIVNSLYNLQPLHPTLNSSKNSYVSLTDALEFRERILIPDGLDYRSGW